MNPKTSVILLFFFLAAIPLYAEPSNGTIFFNSLKPGEAIGEKIQILEDPAGSLTLEDILSPAAANKFHPSHSRIPNFGFISSVYWIQFHALNNTAVNRWYLQLAYPKIDSIQYYMLNNGKWTEFKTGDMEVFSKRPVAHRTFLFPFELNEGEKADFYIRFQSEGSHQYPLFIISQDEFATSDRTESFFFGMYYGIVLILAIYNLVLFFLVKDISHLYYFLYITGFGVVMMNLNGLSYQILWPEMPAWENISLPFFIGWTFFWSLLFSKSFLNTAILSPFINKIFYILMICMMILTILSLFIPYRQSINSSAVLVISFAVLVFLAGIDSLKKQYRPARYFLLAWVIFLVGMALYSVKAFGLISYNFFTDYGLQIGSALEMSLLSLGLGDRIQRMNRAKQNAQLLALENETLYQESRVKSQRLELELLKKNIEPHFLLNAINATMVWMQENPDRAVNLLSSLADELRTLVNISGERWIGIQEEIGLCRAHLTVMSLRHDKSFVLNTEGDFTGDQIPPLIFHTIIENGISHGFHDKENGVFILKKVILSDGAFMYGLKNNGSPDSGKNRHTGLGFTFIKTRLEESYPGRWKLEYGPADEGWEVKITIQNPGIKIETGS